MNKETVFSFIGGALPYDGDTTGGNGDGFPYFAVGFIALMGFLLVKGWLEVRSEERFAQRLRQPYKQEMDKYKQKHLIDEQRDYLADDESEYEQERLMDEARDYLADDKLKQERLMDK